MIGDSPGRAAESPWGGLAVVGSPIDSQGRRQPRRLSYVRQSGAARLCPEHGPPSAATRRQWPAIPRPWGPAPQRTPPE